MSKLGLLHSIRASEGRTLVCETVGSLQPLLGAVTNAELAASMGADILLLNAFDVQHPAINALPAGTETKAVVRTLKRLTGRVIGINLEPVDASQVPAEDDHPTRLPPGRLASVENARLALELG
ncbi:MAG: haloacid dehalogenase-like hydrolase, partial [Devosia nanyangense]|nr:haloacid dehalogenase-like hydrolase [Devosia nanyangense]